MTGRELTASVVITTKNRKQDLVAAVRSVLGQSVKPEIVIIDDGSTDGTSETITRNFPDVRFVHHEMSRGYIVRRNEAAQLASGDIIVSIDDDAEFSSPTVVEKALACFVHGRVGAVAIPFIEPNKDNVLMQEAPDQNQVWVTDAFVGTAHALRRDVFLKLGGYRAELVHQGEERDFCLRMLAAGWVTRLGTGDPIIHHESPKRDLSRMSYYGRRNDILFVWQNVPLPSLLPHLAGTTLNGMRSMVRTGYYRSMLSGLAAGHALGLAGWSRRQPVRLETYRLHRQLRRSRAVDMSTIETQLLLG